MIVMIVRIFCPIYVTIEEEDLKKALKSYIRRLISNLEITRLDIISIRGRYISIDIEGGDAEIAKNYLTKVMGTRLSLDDITAGYEYSGKVQAISPNDILVDVGIEPPKYVSIPLQDMVASLFRVKKRLREAHMLMRWIGIRKNFPIVVRIEHIEKNEQTKIFGRLGRRTLTMLKKWLQDRLDRVIVYGILRAQLDKKIRRAKLHKSCLLYTSPSPRDRG